MTDPHELPADLRALEQELQALDFTPRASLGPELIGRYRHDERAVPRPAPVTAFLQRHGRLVGLAAALLYVSALAVRGALGPLAKAVLVDHCCIDLDGQDLADDGLVVESTGGDKVRKLMVYEDRDGDGRFSEGDPVTFTRSGAPTMAPPADEGLVARRFCCVDYDGGGPADDGLLVVNGPRGGIVLAAIYETSRAVTHDGSINPILR